MITRISEDHLKHHLLDKTYEKNLLKIYYFQGIFQRMNQSTKHIAVVCIAQQYIMKSWLIYTETDYTSKSTHWVYVFSIVDERALVGMN